MHNLGYAFHMEVSLRDRKLRVTRDALVEAALLLFAEHGFDETTIDQISSGAGVSPRTFFRHFRTKQDVFFVDHPADLAAFRQSLPLHAASMSLPRAVEQAFEERRPIHEGLDIRLKRLRLLREIPAVRATSYLLHADYEEVITEVLLQNWTDDRIQASCAATAVVATLRRAQEEIAEHPEIDTGHALETALRTLERGIGEAPVLD